MSNTEKLQKVLANLGIGSRREIESWIRQGRIKVDGTTATLGLRVLEAANIYIDGKKVVIPKHTASTRVILYNKPESEICTRHDEKNRITVFSNLPILKNSRWIMIGRLDINSAGLLLFTNNGLLANALMHPKFQIEREYKVRIYGELTQKQIYDLKTGIELDAGRAVAKFAKIEKLDSTVGVNHWYAITVTEGRNRLIRRMLEKTGFSVNRLIRVRFHKIVLPATLNKGEFVELPYQKVQELMEFIQESHETRT